MAVVAANPEIANGGAFIERIQLWYADHIIMALRRQAKIDKGAISLARLMDEIRQEPRLVDRVHWRSLMQGYTVEPLADQMFDRIAGTGEPHLRTEIVMMDLETLRAIVNSCERWADKRVAHHDQGSDPSPPTFGEVDTALNAVSEMLQKYHVLVTGDAIAYTTPVIQYNWKRVFEIPWAAPSPRSEG